MCINQLETLCSAILACRICSECTQQQALPHEPKPIFQLSGTARLLIAGQAPGIRAHQAGRPFSDKSGLRLRKWLQFEQPVFYDASRVAILPMGFCFPGYDIKGSDLPPRSECAPLWRHAVLKLLPRIELVLAIGLYAQSWHLNNLAKRSLTENVKSWRDGLKLSPPVLSLPHPSWRNNGWLKRNPWFEAELLPELQERVSQLVR